MYPTFLLSALICAHAVAAPRQPDSELRTITLDVQVDHSTILDLASGFRRISVTNGDIAEVVAVTATELLVNGKAPGETSLFLWDNKGVRHLYTVRVLADKLLLELIRSQLVQEVGPDVT